MDALKPGQIRVHLQGSSYVCPEANKTNVNRTLGKQLKRIEHYETTAPAAPSIPAPTPAPVIPLGKTKESLLGVLLKDNKINADELIEWIEERKDPEEILIATKGDTRKTVVAAKKKRINELI